MDETHYNRDCRTFSQIKEVVIKIQKILEENGITIYVSGGIVPYLLLNEESNRLHDDIDTICKIGDMEKLRELLKKEGLYKPDWDSKNYSEDKSDYGFEVEIEGVPFGIYPFNYENGIVTQYSFDPYNKMCKTKIIPMTQLTDYIYTYESKDGKMYSTMSLEYIKLSKDYAKRLKDIMDSKKILEYGIRDDVMSRINMYKEVRKNGREADDKSVQKLDMHEQEKREAQADVHVPTKLEQLEAEQRTLKELCANKKKEYEQVHKLEIGRRKCNGKNI